jgi:hypothetical protein
MWMGWDDLTSFKNAAWKVASSSTVNSDCVHFLEAGTDGRYSVSWSFSSGISSSKPSTWLPWSPSLISVSAGLIAFSGIINSYFNKFITNNTVFNNSFVCGNTT